jgi:glycosyltransferase involved in cell wall biosynthesis
VPYPPDYGGVFDLFYKIKTLHELGVSIHLHCFDYGRGRQTELEKYCFSVNYYPRKKYYLLSHFRLPYIVSSRINKDLLENLSKDDYPLLLELILCTYFLFNGDLKEKKVFVRLHNVEYEYYKELMKSAKNIFKKLYYRQESKLLKRYEMNIANKATFIAVSENDKKSYEENLLAKSIKYLPVFLPFTKIKSETGTGSFCLYHGNLSVAENERAVVWLLENIFDSLNIPFVIAGKNPSSFLKKLTTKYDNVSIVSNPSAGKMDELIRNAQIHLLPSFNNTGIKIKLLNALFNGRFIISNAAGVEGTGLESLCEISETKEDWQNSIKHFFQQTFTEEDINARRKILEETYNNVANGEKLIQWIW